MSPVEKYVKDHIRTCELCFAFPPNALSEAYGNGFKHHCRCTGLTVGEHTPACSMFLMDERIAKKIEDLEKEKST